MGEFQVLIFCLFIYLIQLPTGNCLKCGACQSEMKPECVDASKVTSFQNCDSSKFVCRTVEYYSRRENRNHVSRACVEAKDLSGNDACSKVRLSFFGRVNSCQTCNTDYCNTNLNSGVKQTKVDEKYAVPQTVEEKVNFSTTLRSSFRLVIMFIFFNLYRTCIS